MIDTESQSKRKHVYNPRLVKCPQQHGDIISVCPVCTPWNDATFKIGAKIEICQSKTFVHARRCLMTKSHFDAESALNKKGTGKNISTTFGKESYWQKTATLCCWLPVAIGPSGFLLIIIMIAINMWRQHPKWKKNPRIKKSGKQRFRLKSRCKLS